MAGLMVVLLVYGIAVVNWRSASGVAAVVGSVSGVIGTIVGAFFGVQVGAAGKEKAEDQRDRAQEQLRELAFVTSPATYEALRAARADLFGPR